MKPGIKTLIVEIISNQRFKQVDCFFNIVGVETAHEVKERSWHIHYNCQYLQDPASTGSGKGSKVLFDLKFNRILIITARDVVFSRVQFIKRIVTENLTALLGRKLNPGRHRGTLTSNMLQV
jgi:hypothetical protein